MLSEDKSWCYLIQLINIIRYVHNILGMHCKIIDPSKILIQYPDRSGKCVSLTKDVMRIFFSFQNSIELFRCYRFFIIRRKHSDGRINGRYERSCHSAGKFCFTMGKQIRCNLLLRTSIFNPLGIGKIRILNIQIFFSVYTYFVSRNG